MAEPALATIGEALGEARRRLADADVDTPRLDAEVLLGFVLSVDRGRLVIDRDRALDAASAARFEALVERRAAREPVAYIVGRREFRRIELSVDPRVLIPRPETELLVEVGLGLGAGLRVLDVGTGSGAVALALADERPDLAVWGSDVSVAALEVARRNARRLGLGVEFLEADLLGDWRGDAVLANLPYVPAGARLAAEISGWEPAGALFAGEDGLDVVRRLVAQVWPERAGVVALEIGAEQAAEVVELLRGAGYGDVAVLRDLAGLDRVVVGRA